MEQRGGRFCRLILGIVLLLAAVKTANDAFADHGRLRGIIGFSHACRETRQFFPGEFSLRIELIGKSNNARLIFRVEAFDLFYDLIGSHDLMLPHMAATFNRPSAGIPANHARKIRKVKIRRQRNSRQFV